MSSAPEAPRPLPVKREKGEQLSKKEKRQSWREKKEQRQKYWVTAFLAFVFGVTSVAFFASNPFNGGSGPSTSNTGGPLVPPEEAELKSLNDAVAASPTSQNYFNLGEAYYKQRKWPEAAGAYQKALDKDPNDVMAMSHLGTVMINQDHVKDAIPVLEKAEAAQKQQAAALKAKGDETNVQDINLPERLYQAYTLTGQKDKAAAELTQAADIDLLHTHTFLLTNSEEYYVEDDKKDVAQQFVDDGTRLGAKIAPKLKDDIYPKMVLYSLYGAMLDKQHPDKQTKVKGWLKMLSEDLMKTDPPIGLKISTLLAQIEHPPTPVASSAPSSAPASAAPASAAPAPPATPEVPVPTAETGAPPTTEAPGPH